VEVSIGLAEEAWREGSEILVEMVTLAKLRYLNPDIRLAGTLCEHDSNLNQSLTNLDMSHPFHCDAEFLSFLDGGVACCG
jgi:hypothetical protein